MTENKQQVDVDNGNDDPTVTIHVSVEEAETIATALVDSMEDHLADHVRYCIGLAKKGART